MAEEAATAAAPAPPAPPGALDLAAAAGLLERGGPALWAIGALSVVGLAVILWKVWRLLRTGAWRGAKARRAVRLFLEDRPAEALAAARTGRGLRARLVAATLAALLERGYDAALAREEASRVAKGLLAEARSGLRALETIVTVAPLLGLFGTVLGMIEAFRALQATGARADPSTLAGGIWEALLTTAAGMAVAIPAALALAWFEAVIAGLRRDMEDMASRLLTHAEHRLTAWGEMEPRRAAE